MVMDLVHARCAGMDRTQAGCEGLRPGRRAGTGRGDLEGDDVGVVHQSGAGIA